MGADHRRVIGTGDQRRSRAIRYVLLAWSAWLLPAVEAGAGSIFAVGSDTRTPSSANAMSRCPIPILAAALAIACAEKPENVVHVIAEQAPGLKKNARVQYRGVDVGHVQQVYFTPGGVRIDLLLERDDVPIRTQDTVRLATVGPFGAQVVDIHPGPETAPPIARGATLTKVQTDTTVSLPVGVWRSMVRMLGFKADSAVADTATNANQTKGR
jgi:hypothetical protein